jgi:predicted site-specific integrase-resolvase
MSEYFGADDRLLTSKEVAAIFRVDPKSVVRWGRRGIIEFRETPGGWPRYSEKQVTELKGKGR